MAAKDNVLLSSDPVFKDVLLEMLEGCRDLGEATARMSETVLNALMSMQADEACGAPWGERSEERANSMRGAPGCTVGAGPDSYTTVSRAIFRHGQGMI